MDGADAAKRVFQLSRCMAARGKENGLGLLRCCLGIVMATGFAGQLLIALSARCATSALLVLEGGTLVLSFAFMKADFFY